MKLPPTPFTLTDWASVAPVEYPGSTGTSHWRSVESGELRVRLVEYGPGFLADHWCDRGHVLLVLEGVLRVELRDGTTHELEAGQSFQVSDYGAPAHRVATGTGARVFIVD